jgi:hypothetical protein
MSDAYSFPPYEEQMTVVLNKFGGTMMDTYGGEDITPLRDLKGGGLTGSFKYLYAAPGLEKIVFGVQTYREKLKTYTTLVFPDDHHALPVYSSFWAESQKGSYFIIDLYPTADCICDLGYMEKYLRPLEDLYDEGKKYFKGDSIRNPDWFRALISPYCISTEVSPSTKDSQDRILQLMTGYLDIYYRLWESREPCDDDYMRPLNARKTALRTVLKENDPGGIMLENAVGHELAELTLKALF